MFSISPLVDPPPDIAVEIDITNESLSKFPIYAALSVPEIWQYNGKKMQFYGLTGDAYLEISESQFLPGLEPAALVEALDQSRADGQTAHLPHSVSNGRNQNCKFTSQRRSSAAIPERRTTALLETKPF